MADYVWGRATYPGLTGIMSASYTCGHGITPGTVTITATPQERMPPMVGTFVIFDGRGTVRVPECILERITATRSSSGEEWTITLSDRRWKWHQYGYISGTYNQTDQAGKLIPWTVRSPRELAVLCLRALGESRFRIDLPAGVTRAQALAAPQRLLRPGENFAPTGTNPPINWTAEQPGQALVRLAEQFGRRVVYSLADNAIWVVRPGIGAALPLAGVSLASNSPKLGQPVVPDGIAVYGSPTRFQDRFPLQAVGEEWHGGYVPINELSYAPLVADGSGGVATVSMEWATPLNVPGGILPRIWVDFSIRRPGTDIFDNHRITATARTVTGNETGFQQLTLLRTKILNRFNFFFDMELDKLFDIAVAGPFANGSGVMTITEKRYDTKMSVEADLGGGIAADADLRTSICKVRMVRDAREPVRSWDHCEPGSFASVVQTDRLSRLDAMRLAQKSVFRCYQIVPRNVNAEEGPFDVPGYGFIKRIQQIILEDTKVEQVVPTPPDPNVQVINQGNEPVIINFYNGLSRNMPAAVYGVHLVLNNGTFCYINPTDRGAFGVHTTPTQQVFVDFSVDSRLQMITFSQPVYRFQGEGKGVGARVIRPAAISLETAFTVLNADDNHPECFIRARRLRQARGVVQLPKGVRLLKDAVKSAQFKLGPQCWAVERREDVQMNVYRPYHPTTGRPLPPRILEGDPVARADYYLNAMTAQYLVDSGTTAKYNGVVPISPDGAIMQVTWDVGPNGAETTATRNGEHAVWLPSYPARRRAENMVAPRRVAIEIGANPQRVFFANIAVGFFK